MPLALSRQNTGWSAPKICKQKIDIKSAKAVCKFSKAMQLHFGKSSTTLSRIASTMAPRTRAPTKRPRWGFKRHHCTRARNIKLLYCEKAWGTSRFKPVFGSSFGECAEASFFLGAMWRTRLATPPSMWCMMPPAACATPPAACTTPPAACATAPAAWATPPWWDALEGNGSSTLMTAVSFSLSTASSWPSAKPMASRARSP
mmetsp:Transcript_104866/g.301782  ORF Transcript_104866/g.301782 Transcript_104866/m.301782 type:complete len:202 (-) Transcript_104866:265-870(-)